MDFSDRVTAKRKSYKASTRRQRKAGNGTEEYGDFSDEEDGESLDRKLARLRREIEEVKEEFDRRKSDRDTLVEQQPGEDMADIVALSKALDEISSSQGRYTTASGGKFSKELGTGIKANGPSRSSNDSEEPSTYTITYAPTYQQSHALAKAADFDARLSMLERSLGLNPTDLTTMDTNGASQAVLPTLDTLHRQLILLSESTPSSLDSISRRVRTLTQEAERLEEARKSAKNAQDALRAAGGDISSEDGQDTEQMAKVNALYGTLSTIESLSPILPSLLDRLRSLRAIHADAASASENLEKLEQRQSEMAGDIKKWRDGLRKVEEALRSGESVTNGNMKAVESWVKELEEKMQRL